MLIPLMIKEKDLYLDFAYKLALDLHKSSYPTFLDGIKTKEDFIRGTNYAFQNDNEEILIFKKNNKVYGWVQYYFIKEENQIATYTFLSEDYHEEMVDEFIIYINNKYPNSSIALGLPVENIRVRTQFLNHHFKLEEKSYNCVLDLNNYSNKEFVNVIRLEKENFNTFKSIHDKAIGIYWNSQRIYDDFDNWLIYTYHESDKVTSALYCMKEKRFLEIFGIDYDNIFNKEAFINVLIGFLNDCKKNQDNFICYFSDNFEEITYLQELGFKLIGEYNYLVLNNL